MLMSIFAVVYHYPADSEKIANVRPKHREFIAGLKSEGKIIGSGPFTDGSGGALITLRLDDAATLDDVRALMNSDPFYVEGALTGRSFHTWNPVMNSFDD